MKKIEAIIRSSKFEDVREGLHDVGINFFTFLEVKGYGLEKSDELTYRGVPYDAGYIPRLKLELIVEDASVDKVVTAIIEKGRTGKIGDGKVIISDIDNFIRIRNGESVL